tara:strand:+ start:10909 stop:12450 length:1542 start_codon:yes stop_codon:yes gene_type:complete
MSSKQNKLIIKKNLKKKEVSKILVKRGYSIIKEFFTNEQLENIKNSLTVKPFVNEDFGPGAQPYPIYLESTKKLYLPKHYAFKELGEPDKNKLSNGFDIDVEFKGSLRDNQKPVIEKFLDTCKDGPFSENSRGGIISVGCGFGKTIMALYLLSKISKKTIVIVHKEFLLNQWKKRIEEYLPDARVGIIQANKIDIKNKDIVIAMLQSISMKEYDIDETFGNFGFTIVDECHHISAEVFCRSLPKINSMYSLGLSATPKRADGLSHVFESFLGPMVYKSENKDNKIVRVNTIFYNDTNKDYCKEELSFNGKVCIPRMINNIVENSQRNEMIKYIMIKLVNEGKQVLVLSDRRDHLSKLFSIASTFTTVGYYIGGMKQKELEKSESKKIILGTYAMSSEGLDIPTLDAVIFTTPKSSIEQSIGRITRKKHESMPIAYDIVDNIHLFPRQYAKRETVYKRLKYEVYTLSVYVEENTQPSYFEYQIDTGFTKKEFSKKGKKKEVEEIAECIIDSDED